MISADSLLFRCSSLGHLNPGAKGISDAVSKHLVDIYISAKYKRREELKNKYLDKGNEQNDNVLIPFAGSGSEIVGCKDLKRNCIAFEIESKYIDIIKQRTNDAGTIF